MVLNRIKYKIGPLHKQLYAYQEGLGTSECITEVLSCINQNKATIVFIDFEKAIELASPTAMLQSVAKKGVKGHLLAWTKNYVLGRQARVKFQGVVSTYHELENGTPQGGILSPLLFNILMENIASLQLPEGVDIFVYADDVCVIARGAVRTMKMQRALNAISHKSNELGLKINIGKTKAMSIKAPNPLQPLTIGMEPLEWVDKYTYLGVIIDKQLTFRYEIKYLKERTNARTAVMRYMCNLKEGANEHVQMKYYQACTRALVEYASPALTGLTVIQKGKVEVFQNNAMRLMLGAPLWTRLCNLRMETRLPTLEDRIAMRNARTVAKMFLSNRDSITKKKVREELEKHPAVQTPNSYGKDHSNNIKRLGLAGILLQLNPDTAQSIQHIPPWKKQVAKFSYTKLPRAKENCTIEELRNAATAAMQTAETIGAQIYYTDGTVDPRTQTAGAAVHSCNFTACWRTSNNVSTLQTELVAIQQALRYSIENEEGPIVIHTDSRSSMQALQQDKNKENKSLIADIKSLLYQHNERNRLVTFNWIPSHIGIPGNEKADELAKSTRHIQNIQVHIQPALQQIKNKIKTHLKDNLIKDLHMWAENGSPSATWYKWATELEPPPIDKNTPRKQAVCIHRLRLGYKANWEIREDIQRPCDHCGDTPQHALLHYLLECRETAQLRGDLLVDTNAPEAGKAAATLAKAIVESFDTHSQLLSRLPPPR
ncbi:uncharacterized protein [Palaemon carinicauda]|uniref:uncharacterized protein n=1 Tax=Palaemon carinicauda TaxID=392227 RepID=UPI0035B58077